MTYKPCASCTSDKLNEAFKALRRQGLIARQNFGCCAGCAGHKLATQLESKVESGSEVTAIGAVFYTRQDRVRVDNQLDVLAGEVRRGRTVDPARAPKLSLRFGPVATAEHGTFGLPASRIAPLIVATLREHGLDATWSGDVTHFIEVVM